MTPNKRLTELLNGIKAAMPLIAMANEAGVFKNCAAPMIGTRTLAMLERITDTTPTERTQTDAEH